MVHYLNGAHSTDQSGMKVGVHPVAMSPRV